MIELLVVIGIIVLLISLALPMVIKAHKTGKRTRVAADMQSISVALEAYRTDFGDYPRPDTSNLVYGTGFCTLGQALFSPGGPATDTVPSTFKAGEVVNYNKIQEYVAIKDGAGQTPGAGNAYWKPFPYSDGVNGPGFKIRPGLGSKTYPPYLQSDKFKLRGLAVLDIYGNPYLYFPASPRKPNTQEATGYWYVDDYAINNPPPTHAPPTFEAGENLDFFTRPLTNNDTDRARALMRMAAFMTQNFDPTKAPVGKLMPADPLKPSTLGPFILWSAGPDDFYGVTYNVGDANPPTKQDIDKCDDIVNFER